MTRFCKRLHLTCCCDLVCSMLVLLMLSGHVPYRYCHGSHRHIACHSHVLLSTIALLHCTCRWQLLTLGLVSGSLQSFADLIRSRVLWYMPAVSALHCKCTYYFSGPLAKQKSCHGIKLLVLVQTNRFKVAMPDAGCGAVLPVTQSGYQASKLDSRRQGSFGGRVIAVYSAY